eukprot:g19193.t1
MAAVRKQLAGASEELRTAFSDLRAIDEEVSELTAGVGDLPLSEAAARVSQGARTAVAVASKVMKAAEAAGAVASKAATVVAAAQAAKSEADKEAAVAAQAAAVAAQKAAAAAEEVAALEVKIQTPSPVDHNHASQATSGGENNKGQGERQDAGSSGGAAVGNGSATVVPKADIPAMAEGEGKEEGGHGMLLSCQEPPTANSGPGGRDEEMEGKEVEHGDEHEDREGKEYQSSQGKRKLQNKGECPRRGSVRAASSRQLNYAESRAREPSKRQRKASVTVTGAASGSAVAAAASRKAADGEEAAPSPANAERPSAGPAAPAVSEDKKKKQEEEALKMLEFYFGDSNFGWDRFMQSKAGEMGENLMDVAILMTFNKLKNIIKDAGLSFEEGMALIARLGEASPHLRVSEDKKQIGRAEPLNEDKNKERLAHTVQTTGYKKDSSIKIEDVEKLFADTGKARFVKICRVGGSRLTSIFAEFETTEEAEKAVERSEKYSYEEKTISVRSMKMKPKRNKPSSGRWRGRGRQGKGRGEGQGRSDGSGGASGGN